MLVFQTPVSVRHDPEIYFRRGAVIPHPENVTRFQVLLDAVTRAGFDIREPQAFGDAPILAVHDAGYVAFLRTAWSRRGELGEVADEMLTGHFAKPQMHRKPEGMLGLLGYYSADTSTPIRAGTWDAVFGTAQAAVAAAEAATREGVAYALCRPPGHHAFADCAAGFCYLNNVAIAVEHLREQVGGRVAVLDIDVHHGNGAQAIFYDRNDVLTVSVHADTAAYYPYYAGYADEIGKGAGEGYNVNLPLAHELGDEAFLGAIARGLDRARAENVQGLAVALGLDAAEEDPLGVLNVTTRGFARSRPDDRRGRPAYGSGAGGRLSVRRPAPESGRLPGRV